MRYLKKWKLRKTALYTSSESRYFASIILNMADAAFRLKGEGNIGTLGKLTTNPSVNNVFDTNDPQSMALASR